MDNLLNWMSDFRLLYLKLKKKQAKMSAWILSGHSVNQMFHEKWGLPRAGRTGGSKDGEDLFCPSQHDNQTLNSILLCRPLTA